MKPTRTARALSKTYDVGQGVVTILVVIALILGIMVLWSMVK